MRKFLRQQNFQLSSTNTEEQDEGEAKKKHKNKLQLIATETKKTLISVL